MSNGEKLFLSRTDVQTLERNHRGIRFVPFVQPHCSPKISHDDPLMQPKLEFQLNQLMVQCHPDGRRISVQLGFCLRKAKDPWRDGKSVSNLHHGCELVIHDCKDVVCPNVTDSQLNMLQHLVDQLHLSLTRSAQNVVYFCFEMKLNLAAFCWFGMAHLRASGAILSDKSSEMITTDVCIIGGGASGTYAAIRLHDLGIKVTLVEQQAELGGHTHSFTDPDSNRTIDYGAVNFRDIAVARNFLERLGVAFQNADASGPPEAWHVNMRTGQRASPDPDDLPRSLERYREQVAKYPFLEKGYYLPDPVPDDLLMPFGEFAEKYDVGAMVSVAARGYGDILQQPTLYVMKVFNLNWLDNMRDGFLRIASGNSHEIYDRALQILGPRVFLQGQIFSVDRSVIDRQILHVQTPDGIKVIRSKKILVAMNPSLDNMRGFDLDSTEKALFGSFKNTGYYASLVYSNTSLPTDTLITNTDPSTPYKLPRLPAVYAVIPTGVENFFVVDYGSHSTLPDDVVKSDIITSVNSLTESGLVTSADEGPQIVAYRSHSPYQLTVSRDAIEDGFYRRLYSLQGRHNTFYTGGAFHAYSSSPLWQFTEELLPRIMESTCSER